MAVAKKSQRKTHKGVRLSKEQIKMIKISSLQNEVSESNVIRTALNEYFKI